VYPHVNNGVYRSGFAQSQQAYDAAIASLFAALEDLDGRLATQRFLGGAKFSWLDLRLYHTLVRFDPVYVVYCPRAASVAFSS
jgi:putative glutathione S-transferase